MIPHLVPEIEGGYPERDGEEGGGEEEGGEGLVLENSRSWIKNIYISNFFSHSQSYKKSYFNFAPYILL